MIKTKRYKVVTRDSVYYGRIGIEVPRKDARKNWNKQGQAGRDTAWWNSWDLFIKFDNRNDPDDEHFLNIGVGFLSNELELVDDQTIEEKAHWKNNTIRSSVK